MQRWGAVCLKSGEWAYGFIEEAGEWVKVSAEVVGDEERLPVLYPRGEIHRIDELTRDMAESLCALPKSAAWVIVDTTGGERICGEKIFQSDQWIEVGVQMDAASQANVRLPWRSVAKLTEVHSLDIFSRLLRTDGMPTFPREVARA